MGQLRVNWREVSDLSKRTLENSAEFEDARDKYQKIIQSLGDCWKGSDAATFITNADNFLEYLKNDSNYMSEMGNFFKTGSNRYNGVVDEYEEKMSRYNQRFEEEVKDELLNGGVNA